MESNQGKVENTNIENDSARVMGSVGLLETVQTNDVWTGGDYFKDECRDVAFGD